MFKRLEKLIEFVEKNASHQLYDLLLDELLADKRIPLKYIAGALVIAAERHSIECFNVILDYNSNLEKKIPASFIKAAESMIPTQSVSAGYVFPKVCESTLH
jgi:hypothetical protein